MSFCESRVVSPPAAQGLKRRNGSSIFALFLTHALLRTTSCPVPCVEREKETHGELVCVSTKRKFSGRTNGENVWKKESSRVCSPLFCDKRLWHTRDTNRSLFYDCGLSGWPFEGKQTAVSGQDKGLLAGDNWDEKDGDGCTEAGHEYEALRNASCFPCSRSPSIRALVSISELKDRTRAEAMTDVLGG